MGILKNEKLVFDNAVLSNFSRIEKLGLIVPLSDELFVTREVIMEVEAGLPNNPKLEAIISSVQAGRFKVQSPSEESSIILLSELSAENFLGSGEISAMVLAKEIDGIFLTDDQAARSRAARLGVRVLPGEELRDTVNCLMLLKDTGQITEKDFALVKEMLANQRFKF